jgi:hypothetical protein
MISFSPTQHTVLAFQIARRERSNRVAAPGHARRKCWIREEFLAGGLINAFVVVVQEFGAIENHSTYLGIARGVHLCSHIVEYPFPLAWVEHIDGQSRDDRASVAVLLPVEGKGVEVVSLEIHHWVELIHQSEPQP